MIMSDTVKRLLELQSKRRDLTQLAADGTVDEEDILLFDMITAKERKLKKKAVEEVHQNTITELNIDKHGNGKIVTLYQTNAPWKESGKIRKSNLDDLYEELFEHYYGHMTPTLTVAEAFELWMQEREKQNSANYLTRVHNRADWNHYFMGRPITKEEKKEGKEQFEQASFVHKKISDVKVTEIVRHYKLLIGNERITKKAFTNAKSVLNGVFSYAANHDIPCINPYSINTKEIQKRCKPEADNSQKVYSEEDRSMLLSYLEAITPQTTSTLAIRLSFCLGVRIGELRAVHWEDYDPDSRTLYIHRQITSEPKGKVHRCQIEKAHMKGRNNTFGKRVIPLSDYAVGVLEQLRTLNGDKKYILNARHSNNPITEHRFNFNLKKACEAINITYLSSHKIRFGVATSLYNAGVEEHSIQLLLGHHSVSTTRHYDRRDLAIKIPEEKLQSVLGGMGTHGNPVKKAE